MRYFLLVLALLVVTKLYLDRGREIARLEKQIKNEPEKRQQLFIDTCESAVYRTCFYADCAVLSIEQIQEKVCKLPEGI